MAPSTVWKILKDASGESPSRADPSWGDPKSILTVDFFHVETVLLRQLSVLFFIEHGTWHVYLIGFTTHPTGVGSSAGLQPAHGCGLARTASEVRDPGLGGELVVRPWLEPGTYGLKRSG
jgi:hypothetical protein